MGLYDTLSDVISMVSPVAIVLDAARSAENRKFPEVLASQHEMSVTTSPLVPAHDDHVGVFDSATAPAAAVPHVTAIRVVTDDTADVPDAPGFPVCKPR